MSLLLCLILALLGAVSGMSQVKLDDDGGYTDLVVKIEDGDGAVPQDECPKILKNIRVRVFIFADAKMSTRQ